MNFKQGLLKYVRYFNYNDYNDYNGEKGKIGIKTLHTPVVTGIESSFTALSLDGIHDT